MESVYVWMSVFLIQRVFMGWAMWCNSWQSKCRYTHTCCFVYLSGNCEQLEVIIELCAWMKSAKWTLLFCMWYLKHDIAMGEWFMCMRYSTGPITVGTTHNMDSLCNRDTDYGKGDADCPICACMLGNCWTCVKCENHKWEISQNALKTTGQRHIFVVIVCCCYLKILCLWYLL